MAVVILAAQGYRSEDFNAWYEEALERDMEDQAKLQNHEDKGNSSQVGPPPTGNPHGCDCKGECKELRHGQVPFKERVRTQIRKVSTLNYYHLKANITAEK